MKKRLTKLKWIGVTLASLGALASFDSAIANERSMRAESDGGLMVFSPEDSSFWFQLGGRLAFDETWFSGGAQDKEQDFPTGGNIRYALLKFAGGVGEYVNYNLTLKFNGTTKAPGIELLDTGVGIIGVGGNTLAHPINPATNGTGIDFEDAWLGVCSEFSGMVNKATARVGQYTPPTTIDNLGRYGTNNDTFFLEPALDSTAFGYPGKVLGVEADTSAFDMFVLRGSVHQPRQNNDSSSAFANTVFNNTDNPIAFNIANYGNQTRSDRLGGAARLTFAPVHTEDTVYHLGVLGRYQSMNNQNDGNVVIQSGLFATAPEARARTTARLVGITFMRARSYNVVTGEALAMWGPLWLEGEYHQANVQRVPWQLNNGRTIIGSGNNQFHGWHIQGGYMLTGESRVYSYYDGALRNPRPIDKCGAWEVVARFSFVNLVDKDIYGGSEHNTSVGVNWFINNNVRIAANYIRANIRAGTIPGGFPFISDKKRQLDIFGLRFGVEF